MESLIKRVKACTICAAHLPFEPRPVFQINPEAKILIAGQAPGKRVHETGVPFNDPSGERLRDWMGINHSIFYDERKIAILPMGFCYPGTGRSGDLPPRPECAEKWRNPLLNLLPNLKLTLVIGQYAQDWHLAGRQGQNLTETVQDWQNFWPKILPLPHPSPRNNLWLKKNPWFLQDIIPLLQNRVSKILKT